MPSVAAKPAHRLLPALNTARYAMFGPGVSSITRHVRAKAPNVSTDMESIVPGIF